MNRVEPVCARLVDIAPSFDISKSSHSAHWAVETPAMHSGSPPQRCPVPFASPDPTVRTRCSPAGFVTFSPPHDGTNARSVDQERQERLGAGLVHRRGGAPDPQAGRRPDHCQGVSPPLRSPALADGSVRPRRSKPLARTAWTSCSVRPRCSPSLPRSTDLTSRPLRRTRHVPSPSRRFDDPRCRVQWDGRRARLERLQEGRGSVRFIYRSPPPPADPRLAASASQPAAPTPSTSPSQPACALASQTTSRGSKPLPFPRTG